MTINSDIRPFITTFATPLEHAKPQALRYDLCRQLSEIRVGQAWVDAANAFISTEGGTRFTKVAQETSDDD